MADAAKVTSFEDFLTKHGADALDRTEDSSPESRKADVPSAVSPPPSAPVLPETSPEERREEQRAEETPLSLDEATLEALNLQEPGTQEHPGGSDEDTDKSIDLDAVSSSLGFDKDLLSVRDGKVYVQTKVDGDVADKSLADLVKGYQLQEHTTRKSMDLAKEREAWEEQTRKQKEEFEHQAQLVGNLLRHDEQEINERYGKIKWDEVRAQDPAQYAALVADYNREMAGVREKQQAAAQFLQKEQMERQEQAQKYLAEIKEREFQTLTTKLGWTKDTAAEKAKPIQSYLQTAMGYRPEELKQIFDHRFVVLADKAKQWDELQSRIKDIRDKKIAPKHVVPAGSVSAQGAKASTKAQLREAQGRLRDSGRVEDAVDVFKNIPGLLE